MLEGDKMRNREVEAWTRAIEPWHAITIVAIALIIIALFGLQVVAWVSYYG